MNKAKARYLANKKRIDKSCEVCGCDNNLQRHHSDYKKPTEVIIMCRKCHFDWHRKNKALNNNDGTHVKMISFKGNKIELHRQLKIWCAMNDQDVNTKVIDLIEKFVKNNK